MSKKFEVFISYRRKGGYDTAKLIYDRLRLDGYSASFDIDTLVNGNFDTELEQRVNECKDFLLVLSPGIFDRFFAPDPDYDPENDWVRREIAHALRTDKNIIPLFLEGFTFPKSLPDDVKDITRKNAIDLYPKYFEAAYDKMKSFLISKPSWIIKQKKKIILFASIAFLILSAFSYLTISQLQDEKKASEQRREQRREQRLQEKTFHWNGPDDAIGQAIFEKISETGLQKTECSGNGLIVTINNINCRGETEITCFYSPRISFANCNNRPITFLEKKERFRTTPQASEAGAKEELANELRKADFSDWITAIRSMK
ncbi:MAG: toll/interleukin-1 receptor domain-containing protein [Fibromonadaceae bacterium]|jgi:hypothetical protein|nr:toll/interleukin-1 receptor domain-containing protein [Fibromonadaceae bacterium]